MSALTPRPPFSHAALLVMSFFEEALISKLRLKIYKIKILKVSLRICRVDGALQNGSNLGKIGRKLWEEIDFEQVIPFFHTSTLTILFKIVLMKVQALMIIMQKEL